MKKQIIMMLAVATALASCSKSETDTPEVTTPGVPELPVPITLSAGIDVTATPQSRADFAGGPVEGATFPANVDKVFGVTAYSAKSSAPTDFTTPYFKNINVNSGAGSALAFASNQYYPANGDKVYYYAYAPVVGSITTAAASATASYTITGQEDIMAAQVVSGIAKPTTAGATQTQPVFAFTHKLMQLKFVVVKDATFQETTTVTNITVKDIKTTASLNILSGVLSFSGTANQTVKIDPTSGNNIVATPGTTLAQVLMIEPAASVKLSVSTGSGATLITYPDITISGLSNAAATSHAITLTFKQNQITTTAAITPWSKGADKPADII